MTEKQPVFVVQNIAIYNRAGKIRVGVVGPNGLPAFNTDIPVPHEVFSSDKEQFLALGHEFILFKPLVNDERCHRCHNPKDKTRGMIVIKTSMVEAETEVNTTAKRLLLFAFFLGLTSEIFLLRIVRKTILGPLEILNKGSEFLRAGRLDHRIDIKNDDEFGALGQTFNQMASSLEKSHEGLERSVRQKTNELRVISELSTEVFRGNLNLRDIIDQFIESKKGDLAGFISLHDASIEKSSPLNMPALTKSIVESAISFAGMHTAVLWLKKDGCLHLESTFSTGSSPEDNGREVAEGLLPPVLPLDGSFPGRCITEKRSIETLAIENMASLSGLINHYGFRYAVAIPLKFKGAVSGCLTLFKKNDFFMTDAEKAIVLLFAGQSAAAINNSKLFSSLKTEKEFSEAIFNCASSGIMVVGAEGEVLKVNDAGAEILRTRPGNIIGKKLAELIPGSEPMLLVEEGFFKEIVVQMPDGSSIPVGFNNSYLSNPLGGKGGVVILFKDLSEIKRLQAGIKKKEYFETMEKVISGVAHEVRNPLFGISSVGHILESELVTPQHQALVKAMLKETGRMQHLIEELLLYTRPTKLITTDVDLGNLMEELRHFVDSKKVNIIFSVTIPSMLILRADRDKITQVFVNLITNALDAAKSTVTASAGISGGLIEIMVADDGAGIPPENLDKIFDPFFTTKRGGTGLGLSICKKIVEDHGGRIEVKSTEGKGTVVTLTFME